MCTYPRRRWTAESHRANLLRVTLPTHRFGLQTEITPASTTIDDFVLSKYKSSSSNSKIVIFIIQSPDIIVLYCIYWFRDCFRDLWSYFIPFYGLDFCSTCFTNGNCICAAITKTFFWTKPGMYFFVSSKLINPPDT